jgi:5-hydroxyisourate hydrolase
MKSFIRVIDSVYGRPAAGLGMVLYSEAADGWREVIRGCTDGAGICPDTLNKPLERGYHRLVFRLDDYFAKLGSISFYPKATVDFRIEDPHAGNCVTLLITPFAYSTYCGIGLE